MPGTITPLPVMMEEEEIEREKRDFLKKQPPESIVLRYGYQKKLIELRFNGETSPGCGQKFVIRSPRGLELAEMVTTVCGNGGCGHSVTRKQMLSYIEQSGGKHFPFTKEGRIDREATPDDLAEQKRLDAEKPRWVQLCKQLIRELDLDMKLVDVEPLLGGERIVFYYLAEQYVDFRQLVARLGSEAQTRVEMVQLNHREEARIVADYEKCGQHCCCKQFLKVLKPVSMRSAKVQKATLDPSKISGRCGRLMCCLRYEDKTYSDLKKNLPHKKTVVETEDGIGTVLDSQILTQLVLVKIPGQPQPNAYPVESLRKLEKDEVKAWQEEQARLEQEARERWQKRQERKAAGPRPRRDDSKPAGGKPSTGETAPSGDDGTAEHAAQGDGTGKKRRRRRRKRGPEGGNPGESDSPAGGSSAASSSDEPQGSQGYRNDAQSGDGGPKKRRRRRRRRGGGGGSGDGGGGSSNGD